MSQFLQELFSESIEQRLQRFGDKLHEKYATAKPFPHIVIEDFLPAALLETALAQFPEPSAVNWLKFEAEREKKLAFCSVEKMPDRLREVLYFLNSPVVLQFLEKLTGIEGLIADAYYYGGGLHQIKPGGHLDVHADFNKLNRFNLDRRLNLLLYMNQDWKEEYGGHLELWNQDMTKCVKKILPVFNRCVIFNTTSTSYHGHPTPLTCPEGRTRKSIATYYYTAERNDGQSAEWHSTLFQTPKKPEPILKRGLKKILPPVIVDAIKIVLRR